MSEYLAQINKHFKIRTSIIALLTGTIVTLIGFCIYPNAIFYFAFIGIMSIFIILTPVLIIWKMIDLKRIVGNKILKVLISIWIGLFFMFITPHQIVVKIGNAMWEKTAHELETAIDHFYKLNQEYPENIEILNNEVPIKKGFIQNRYFDLVQINVNGEDYNLLKGFWIGDGQYWDSDVGKWKSIL